MPFTTDRRWRHENATARPPKRVLVRTLPLTNGNYGGILQAYALQRSLRHLGVLSVVDISNPNSICPNGNAYIAHARLLARKVFLATGYAGILWGRRSAVHYATSAPLLRFVRKHIDYVQLYSRPNSPNQAVLDLVDAFVAGSDQVWRRAYGNVRWYLFADLTGVCERPKISYAASFGSDHLSEYESDLIADSAQLAQRFMAISVRESGAVRVARETWGVKAEQHIDPVFLLEPAEYAKLAACDKGSVPRSQLVAYVLDNTSGTQTVLDQVCRLSGEEAHSLVPPSPATYLTYLRKSTQYRKPSLESWLNAISSARFLVTDSFHGTALAILHNVPFLSVVNRERGAARFVSLLDTFGLRERLVEPGATVDAAVVTGVIDWAPINETIAQERRRAFGYLQRMLLAGRQG